MKRIMRKLTAIAMTAVAAATIQPATRAAAEYPERPITVVVPFAAGSSNDTRARIIAPVLSEILGQPIVVEDKPGAAGMIGIEYVAQAEPDGYTLLFTAGAITLLPVTRKAVRWDPLKDIKPVAILGGSIFGLAVNKDVPADTMQEFIELLRKEPGKYNASISGSSSEMGTHLFQLRTQTKMELIPYEGTGKAVNAVVSGETDATILDSAAFLPVLETGRLKVLAIANDERISTFPDTPTAREAGVDFVTGSTFGVYAPGGTPDDIVEKLNAALLKALENPEVATRLTGIGLTVKGLSVEDSWTFYVNEMDTFREVIREANLPMIE